MCKIILKCTCFACEKSCFGAFVVNKPWFTLALFVGPTHRPAQNNGAISFRIVAVVLFLTGENAGSGAPAKTLNMSLYFSSHRALMLQKDLKRHRGSGP